MKRQHRAPSKFQKAAPAVVGVGGGFLTLCYGLLLGLSSDSSQWWQIALTGLLLFSGCLFLYHHPRTTVHNGRTRKSGSQAPPESPSA